MDLKKRTSTAVIWDIGGTFVRQTATFGLSIVLARLLTPEEFGIIGMVMVAIVIAEVFVDFGFGSALIQRQDINNHTYNSVFYFNIAVGLVLTLIFFFIAPAIGRFYDNMEVVDIARFLSFIFFLNSFTHVQIAILKKKLDFKSLTIRTTISAILGGIVGVICAFSGFGVYSLVAQHISTALIGLVLLWSISGWKPSLSFSWEEIRKLSSFGSYMLLDKLASTIVKRLDVVLVGKLFSPAVLGFFTRSQSLRDLILKYSSKSITKIFYPVLSSLQDDEEEFSRIYFRVQSLMTFVSFGLTGVLFLSSRDIIVLLFGYKWEPTVGIFQLMALSTAITPISHQLHNAFLSRGKAKENFSIGMVRKALRISLLLVAYFYNLHTYLVALIFLNFLIFTINLLYVSKFIRIDIKRHLKVLFHCLIPLVPFIYGFYFFNVDETSFLLRSLFTLAFGSTYVLYNLGTKQQGATFILKNFMKIVNRKMNV